MSQFSLLKGISLSGSRSVFCHSYASASNNCLKNVTYPEKICSFPSFSARQFSFCSQYHTPMSQFYLLKGISLPGSWSVFGHYSSASNNFFKNVTYPEKICSFPSILACQFSFCNQYHTPMSQFYLLKGVSLPGSWSVFGHYASASNNFFKNVAYPEKIGHFPSISAYHTPMSQFSMLKGISLSGSSSVFGHHASASNKFFKNVTYPEKICHFPSISAYQSSFCSQYHTPMSQFTMLKGITVYGSRYVFCGSSNLAPLGSPFAMLMHLYSSETLSLDQVSVFSTDAVEKVYQTIIDSFKSEHDMESSLDRVGVRLTNSLVVEVLHKLHFEEKLAFRFFTWAGHQEYYTHEAQAYNEMIDILSSTKYKVKQFRIVCDLLDYMKRNDKTSVPLEVLLNILRKYTEKHLTHLQKFAKKKKIRVKTQPEINAFNLLLDSLCKCSLVEDAEAMFKRIYSKVKPDANTYNILFFGWCRVRNPSRAMSILEDMIKMGHIPDNFTYNTAIDTFCKAGMVTEAAELLKFMREKGSTMSSPTAKTYTIMIVAFVQRDRMDECFELLGEMINSGCLPDVSTYKELIEGMCLAGKIEAAYKFLEEMGNKGYPPDIVTYNCFLKVLCDNKNSDEAIRLYEKMVEVGCLPSVQTFNMLITMFFDMGDPDGAFETWREMDKKGCLRDTDTYCVMIEGLFGCNKIEDACSLLEEVVNGGMKLPYRKFDSFLMELSGIGDLHAIHRLSEHMRKFYNPAMARRFAVNQKRKSMSLRGK